MAYTDTVTPVQKYNIFTPFFQSTRANGVSRTTNYDCLFCNVSVPPGAIAARSFTGTAIVWTHIECLRQVPGASLSTDNAAKHKAMKAYETRRDAAREVAKAEKRTADILQASEAAPTEPTPFFKETVAEIRADLEAEYLAKLATIKTILEQQHQRILDLDTELAMVKSVAVYAPLDDSPATPARDKPASSQPSTICGMPTKSGKPCKWNNALSMGPCRHHGTSAVVKAMSDPKNETTIEVVQEEASKPAPEPREKPFGTERLTSGTHYAILDGHNKEHTIFRLSGDLFQNGQTGGGYSYYASDEIRARLVSIPNNTPILVTVSGKTITGAVLPNDTEKAARKAQAKAQRTSR